MGDCRTHNGKPSGSAYERILRLAEYSERSSSTVMRRLLDEGYPVDEATLAVEKAMSFGVIDDERYARAFVRSHLSRGEGRDGIRRQLSHSGIDSSNCPDVIEELYDISDDTELNRALSLLEKRQLKGTNKRDKAYRLLIRKGYASSVSSTAARLWCDKIDS